MDDIAHDDLAMVWTNETTGCDLWERTNELRWFELQEGIKIQQKWINAGNGKEEWLDIPFVSGLCTKSEQ